PVAAPKAAPETKPAAVAPAKQSSAGMPKWIIAAAAVAFLVVAGAGAAFIFGGGDSAADLGQLSYSVSSSPAGAEVLVDGEAAGVSPVTLSLAPGEHHVTISLAGYAPYSETVTAAADGPLD